MRKSSWFLLSPVLMIAACWALGRLSAKDAPAPVAEYTRIALIDVAKIYKGLPAFKEQMEALKTAVTEEEKNVKEQAALVAASEAKLKNATEGTTEYDDLQKSIAKSKAEITENIKGRRAYFVNRESDLYGSLYKDIEREVAAYAQENRIDLVLRFTGDEMKTDDPQSVMAYLNRPVIWHSQSLDISAEIVKRLEAKAKKSE
jgi:Skp family chaperone for outer membrane proteins